MTAIIIDDEKNAVNLLELLLNEHCPDVTIIGKAYSIAEGINEITSKNPDIVFLDIEMSHGSGFDLLESIKDRDFDVVFVTAYNQYAVKAFKYNAVDYILKPVDAQELIDTVDKIEQNRAKSLRPAQNYDALLESLKTILPNKLAIHSSDGIEYIDVEEIIHIEAQRSYCTIFLGNKNKIMVSKSLEKVETQLNDKRFFRVHKSYLVNMMHVKKFIKIEGYVLMDNGSQIFVSRRSREKFMSAMRNLYL